MCDRSTVLCVYVSFVECRYRYFFFFKQKTAYEIRISDWSSDVCSSDLTDFEAALAAVSRLPMQHVPHIGKPLIDRYLEGLRLLDYIGRSEERRVGKECVSTCRSRWSPYH